jgi:hypothetical protein
LLVEVVVVYHAGNSETIIATEVKQRHAIMSLAAAAWKDTLSNA